MKYLILLLNVLGFWLMADVAHSAPLVAAIGAISQFVGSIGVIGKLVLTVAINIGLSLVEKALAKKDQPQPAGTKLEISMGDDHPMSFIIGSYATAGKRKYAGTWGDDGKTPNAYFTDVIEIGSLPNRAGERGLTSVWIDDQKVGVLWEEPHPDGRGYGGQNIGAFCLPATNWMAAANACDASVTLDDGSSEPAFRAGYDIQCDQEPLDAVSELLKGCNGRMAEVGGVFKMLVGAPGGAVYSFTDNDIVVTEEQDFQPFPSLSATYNAIEATYPEPAEKWATKDAPGRYNADLEAEDGNRRLPAQIQLLAVPFANQVQRVGLAMIQDYRRFRVHQVSLAPDAYPLEPNDVVSWSSARNGYDEKKFLVVKVEPQSNFLIVVTLKEVDPADYDWHAGLQLPTATGWLGPITPPSQPMIGWTVEPATVKDAGGIDRRPAIKISCAQDLDDVAGVWVQVRLKEAGDVVFDSNSNPYASPYSWLLSGQWTLPNTNYEARGRYLPRSNRATDWSEWLTVKTPNVLIQAGDVLDGAIIASKIADAAVTAAKIMDEAVTNLKLADQAVSTAKLKVAAVTADVLASGAVISTKLADGAVTAAKLAQGAVDATSLASSIKAVEIVSALPVTNNVEGRQVFLTTDGKLYRYYNSAWTSAVPSTDITGQLVSSQIASAAITNQQLAALAIDASKLTDNAITTTKIADDAISTSKLQANAVVAANIAANAIAARNLVLQDWENLVPDNQFQTASAWLSRPANVAVQLITTQAFTSRGSLEFTYVNVGGYQLATQSTSFPVTAGQQYLASIQMVRTSGTKMNVWARIHWIGVDGLILSPDVWGDIANFTFTGPNTVNGVQTFSSTVTPPANAFGGFVRIYVQTVATQTDGNISFGGVSILRKASASLIVDGAITADKIAANAVAAGKIAASAVTAGTIATNVVTAGTIAAGAVSAAQIAADAITSDKLASNSVTTDALAVGSGKNLLQNTSFTMGLDCWVISYQSGTIPGLAFSVHPPGASWAGPNNPTLMLYQSSGPTGFYTDVSWKRPDGDAWAGYLKHSVPCQPNEWFEATAYISAHRCTVELRIGWIGSDGSAVGYTAPSQNVGIAGSSTNPDLWLRLRAAGAAPANAVAASIHIRKLDTVTGQTDSYMFVNKPMLCRIPTGATEATPWSDGGVVMITNGGIVANAITADKIAANAVTADDIAANAVTAGKIAAGAVNAATIAGGTITGDKLAANTIGAGQIAADAITAKQLVLTDFSNMADNGWQAGSLDGWTTESAQAFYNDNSGGDAAGYVLQSLGRNCAISNYIAVSAGESYAFDVWVYNTDSNAAAIYAIGLSPAGAGTPV